MMPACANSSSGGLEADQSCGGGDGTLAFRLAAVVTLLDACHAAYPSLVNVMRLDSSSFATTPAGQASITMAMHAAGPRLALAAAVVMSVRMRSTTAMTALGAALALVQAMDVATCVVTGVYWRALGPAIGAAFQVCAIALLDMQATDRSSSPRPHHGRV